MYTTGIDLSPQAEYAAKTMQNVSVRSFRANLTEYAERVKGGERFVVRRRGRAMALLRAVSPAEQVREIGLLEVRQRLGYTLRAAERGTSWVVTCHGQPQLMLTPVPASLLETDASEEA